MCVNISETEEEAAEAYDIAAIKLRGRSAITNFELSRYDIGRIMASTLPIPSLKRQKASNIEPADQQQQQKSWAESGGGGQSSSGGGHVLNVGMFERQPLGVYQSVPGDYELPPLPPSYLSHPAQPNGYSVNSMDSSHGNVGFQETLPCGASSNCDIGGGTINDINNFEMFRLPGIQESVPGDDELEALPPSYQYNYNPVFYPVESMANSFLGLDAYDEITGFQETLPPASSSQDGGGFGIHSFEMFQLPGVPNAAGFAEWPGNKKLRPE
ncbi:unnamed protein product [Cuscuta europaea]|uniref:AP2/ERF domain-containing protein n=1 Tax=Cuscuta europaea TaxID=41803 RepID=A0A9P0ZN48_CUSEU|nr:unnamed protein product [Cuscuta europaea]